MAIGLDSLGRIGSGHRHERFTCEGTNTGRIVAQDIAGKEFVKRPPRFWTLHPRMAVTDALKKRLVRSWKLLSWPVASVSEDIPRRPRIRFDNEKDPWEPHVAWTHQLQRTESSSTSF